MQWPNCAKLESATGSRGTGAAVAAECKASPLQPPPPVSPSHASIRASAGGPGRECLNGHNPHLPVAFLYQWQKERGLSDAGKKIPWPWIFMWIFKHAWCVFACLLCSLLVECTSKWISDGRRRKSTLWRELWICCYYLLLVLPLHLGVTSLSRTS